MNHTATVSLSRSVQVALLWMVSKVLVVNFSKETLVETLIGTLSRDSLIGTLTVTLSVTPTVTLIVSLILVSAESDRDSLW